MKNICENTCSEQEEGYEEISLKICDLLGLPMAEMTSITYLKMLQGDAELNLL